MQYIPRGHPVWTVNLHSLSRSFGCVPVCVVFPSLTQSLGPLANNSYQPVPRKPACLKTRGPANPNIWSRGSAGARVYIKHRHLIYISPLCAGSRAQKLLECCCRHADAYACARLCSCVCAPSLPSWTVLA